MVNIRELVSSSYFVSDSSALPRRMYTITDILKSKPLELSPEQIQKVLNKENASDPLYSQRSLTAGVLKGIEVNAKFGLFTDIAVTLKAVGERLKYFRGRVDELTAPGYEAVRNATEVVADSTVVSGITSATIARSASSLPLTTDTIIDPTDLLRDLNLDTAISNGFFSINGVSIGIDRYSDTLQDVLNRINTSGAGVTASMINGNRRLQITGTGPGGLSTIQFGDTVNPTGLAETSNFLSALKLDTAETMGTQTFGTPASFLGGVVSLSTDPGLPTQLLGGQQVGFSNDPGTESELISSTIGKSTYKTNQIYNIDDIVSITTTSGSFAVDISTVDTSTSANNAEATFDVLQAVVDEINSAAGNTGLVRADLMSIGTSYAVRIRDLIAPYDNIEIETAAGDDAGTKNAGFGFTIGTPTDTSTTSPVFTNATSINGMTPSTDYGTLTLTGTGTSAIDFLLAGVAPTETYLTSYVGGAGTGAAAFVADRINTFTGTTDIVASVDAEGRILLGRSTAGAQNLTIGAVAADSDGNGLNNSSLGFAVTTVNNGADPSTDFGIINLNGQTINLGVNSNSFLSGYAGGPAQYLADTINGFSAQTNVVASVSGGQVQLTQTLIGPTNKVQLAVVSTDNNANLLDTGVTGLSNSTTLGAFTTTQSLSDLGVSDFDKPLSALSDKLGLLVPDAPAPGRFSINGSLIDFFATDTLQDVIDRINLATGTTDVVASYDFAANKLVLTAQTPGPTPIAVQDIIGNFLEAFRIPQTYSAPAISGGNSLNLNVNPNEIKINPNALLKDLNTLQPIGTIVGSFDVAGSLGTRTIFFDPNSDTVNSLVGKINAETGNTGVVAAYSSTSDSLQFSSLTGVFQLNNPMANGTNLLTQLKLPIGVAATSITTPGIAAQLTGSNTIALNGLTDVAAQGMGTAAIGLSADPGSPAILNGSIVSVGKTKTVDFGDIAINGVTVTLGNRVTSADASATIRSQIEVDYIRDQINAAGITDVTATSVLDAASARYFVQLTGAGSGTYIEVTNQVYTDPLVKNQSSGFFKGSSANGLTPTTDFGMINLNGTPISLGVIANNSPEAADPAQYVADTINDFTPYTRVLASVGTGVDAGKIILTSTNPGAGAGRDIVISAVSNDLDGYAANNFSGAGQAIGFVTQTIAGQDGVTDFGTLNITGPNGTRNILLGTVLNRDNTDSSALDYLLNKINTETVNTGVQALAGTGLDAGKIVLQSTVQSAAPITINTFTNNSDGIALNDSPIGFVTGQSAAGTDPVLTYNLASQNRIGESDLDLTLDRVGFKFGLVPNAGNLLDFEFNGSNFSKDVTITTLRQLLTDVSNDPVAAVTAVFDRSTKKVKVSSDIAAPTLTFSDLPGGGNLVDALGLQTQGSMLVVPSPQELGSLPATQKVKGSAGEEGGEVTGVGALLISEVGITAGTFTLNGQTLTIGEDDTINDLLLNIQDNTGITAKVYGRRLELSSANAIEIGKETDTSNITDALKLKSQALRTQNFSNTQGRSVKLNTDQADTDFGSLTINDQDIDLGLISNAGGVFAAADEIAAKINAFGSQTGVKADVSASGEIILEQLNPATEIQVTNVTNIKNTGIFGGNFDNGEQIVIRSENNLVGDSYDFGDPPAAVRELAQDFRKLAREFSDLSVLLNQLPGDRSSQAIVAEAKQLNLDKLYLSQGNTNEVTVDETALAQALYLEPDRVSPALADAEDAQTAPFITTVSQLIRLPNLAEPARKVSQQMALQVDMDQKRQILQAFMSQLELSASATERQSKELSELTDKKEPSQLTPAKPERRLNVNALSAKELKHQQAEEDRQALTGLIQNKISASGISRLI